VAAGGTLGATPLAAPLQPLPNRRLPPSLLHPQLLVERLRHLALTSDVLAGPRQRAGTDPTAPVVESHVRRVLSARTLVSPHPPLMSSSVMVDAVAAGLRRAVPMYGEYGEELLGDALARAVAPTVARSWASGPLGGTAPAPAPGTPTHAAASQPPPPPFSAGSVASAGSSPDRDAAGPSAAAAAGTGTGAAPVAVPPSGSSTPSVAPVAVAIYATAPEPAAPPPPPPPAPAFYIPPAATPSPGASGASGAGGHRGAAGADRGRAASAPLAVPPEAFEYLHNQLERYAMQALYSFAFGVATEDLADDREVGTALTRLAWLSPAQLRVPEGASNPLVLRSATHELRQINSRLAPEDKLAAITSACTVVYKALTMHARRKAGAMAAAGADDFLPSIIYVVLQANVPKLASNLAYIERYRDMGQLRGRAGYCFINVTSCVEYLRHLTADQVEVPPAQWDANCAAAAAGRLRPWLATATVKLPPTSADTDAASPPVATPPTATATAATAATASPAAAAPAADTAGAGDGSDAPHSVGAPRSSSRGSDSARSPGADARGGAGVGGVIDEEDGPSDSDSGSPDASPPPPPPSPPMET